MNRYSFWFYLYLTSSFILTQADELKTEVTEKKRLHIEIVNTIIEISKTPSQAYAIIIETPSSFPYIRTGEPLNILVTNKTQMPTSLHWHGLILPWREDGTPYVSQAPIPPGGSYNYTFPMHQLGTFYAHAQYGLEQQKLMSQPIILCSDQEKTLYKDIIVLFEDFTFQSIDQVWQTLKHSHMNKTTNVNKSSPPLYSSGTTLPPTRWDDIAFDAYLTNRKTWTNPDRHPVTSSQQICLRLINGSTASHFVIQLGHLQGKIIAVDGNPIIPILVQELPLTIGQRYDVLITIPEQDEDFPIVAQAIGTNKTTGLILTKRKDPIELAPIQLPERRIGMTNELEKLLHPLESLTPKKIDRHLIVELEGDLNEYRWSINHDPLVVKEGERVELIFQNKTNSPEPMHINGHIFQVVAIDGQSFLGAMRDTILVMPRQTVTVQFDANNPGIWPIQSKAAYHAWAGMATILQYEGCEPIRFSPFQVKQYPHIYDASY